MNQPKTPDAPRPKKRDIHGWVILDKPVGMTSTHAVARVKRLFRAKKAGHAGTLDPLASGCLPIALGEATKTVPYVMDGQKAYRFTVAWGAETDTDDAEGRIVASSDARPTRDAIEHILPQFTGAIRQTPPRFSAIKIGGERAYDLAREGEAIDLAPRDILIDALAIAAHDGATTQFEARTGKGAYVRALARDFGRALGCHGHVAMLRRTRVGPFSEADFITLDALADADDEALRAALRPVALALADMPALDVSRGEAGRLMRGQGVILRGRDAPPACDAVAVRMAGSLIAIGEIAQGELRPKRVFHLEA